MRTVLLLLGLLSNSLAWLPAQPGLPPASQPVLSPDTDGYHKVIEPFFQSYCLSCHTGAKPKGNLALDAKGLPNDFLDLAARGKWREVVNVLNSHEMPPKKSDQPKAHEVAAVVDWITQQAVRAELARRETSIVLRRLNRDEYQNTIRDLVGIDYDVSGFPQDPPAGGFDNNGGALSLSPFLLETYLNAARQIVDRALVEGDRPATVQWRFEPRCVPGDSRRVKLDDKNNSVIVNGSNNREEGDFIVVRTAGWDKSVNARNFRMPVEGDYIVRLRAAGRVPDRAQVVESASKILAKRRDEQTQKNPKGEKYHVEQYERDLAHFRNDRMYSYGPPRVRLIQQLGPQPRTVTEFDVEAKPAAPKVYETRVRFTTEMAGLNWVYAYSVPSVLENFWFQGHDAFARPELLIDWFEIEGPIHDTWPPRSHRQILFDSPLLDRDESAYVTEVVTRFMNRAYRRPVSPAEVASKHRLYEAARKEGAGLVPALKRPLVSVLTSPHFLFLVEPMGTGTGGQTGQAGRPLNDHELATRLSYLLWSSLPDAELRADADAGKLRDRATRLNHLERLLRDPKAAAFTQNFAGQWLGLREVGKNPPAPDLYPRYDRHLEVSLVGESEAFFREILHNDLDARNFLRSDFVTINERLGRFYGIPGVQGDAFRKVPVPPGVQRGGLVTQASILTTTSNGTRTSPVKRGTWILKTLLGIDPGLPVANAGEIAPKVPGIDKATVRKRLEIHRTLDQCARCHNKIDPLGFALENFNAAGDWREQEGFGYKGRVERNDPKIDASSEMPDGTRIVGVAGLQEALLQQEDRFLTSLASKLLTYALGRELGLADSPTVKAAVTHMQQNGRTLRSLLRFIVTSAPFESK